MTKPAHILRRTFIAALGLMLCLALASLARAYEKTSSSAPVKQRETMRHPWEQVGLTGAERAWLQAHPAIRVAYDGYFPPYSYLTDDGEFQGLAVDVANRIAGDLGITLLVHPSGVWKDLYEAAKRREVDVVATMVDRPKRREWFVFTQPYIFKSLVIMTRKDDERIARREDIAGKTVALVTGYQYVKRITDEFPSLVPYPVDTMRDGLNAVATGKADAAITFFGAGHYLQTRYLLANLKFAAVYDRDSSLDSFGVRKDWPELAAILRKALNSLSPDEMRRLREKWLADESFLRKGLKKRILTNEERDWLRQHPVVRIGTEAAYPPLIWADPEGKPRGISVDLMQLLGNRLGLHFRWTKPHSLPEILRMAGSGEVDLVTSLKKTPKRSESLLFTQPYIELPVVIIVPKRIEATLTLEKVKGMKVAVGKGYAVHTFLRENHPDLQLVPMADDAACLKALSFNEVDAAVMDLASASHVIETRKITNLRVAGDLGFKYDLSLASRKDQPMLHAILEKGLEDIEDQERLSLLRKWVKLELPEPMIGRKSLIGLLAFAGVVLLMLAFVAVWNRSLSKRVDRKTTELEKELAARKQSEKALGNSQALYQGLVETAQDLIWRCDAEGRYTYLNPAWESVFGYRVEEMLGRRFSDFQSKESAERDRDEFSRLMKGGSVSGYETVHLDKQGNPIYLVFNARFVLNEKGDMVGTHGTAYDITHRKKAEEEIRTLTNDLERRVEIRTRELEESQLALLNVLEDVQEAKAELQEANEKLTEIDRLKSIFIATMSHELRTPLNSIIGFTGILLQGLTGDLNDKQRDQLQRVSRAGKHLLSLINDVIDISKIEAGKTDSHVTEFALSDLVAEAASQFQDEITNKGLDLKLILPDRVKLKTDRRRLLQCVLNYLSNGLKFTEKGSILLTVAAVENEVEIRVTDTGIGIREEDLKRLFQSFVRLDSPLRKNVPGTGLGLYLTRKIAEEILGGGVFAESREGAGSTFGLRVPREIA